MRPLNNQVLIARDVPATQIGLIHIPETSQRWTTLGTVLAVGPEVQAVKPGERVAFGKFSVRETWPRSAYVLARESDLLAVIE